MCSPGAPMVAAEAARCARAWRRSVRTECAQRLAAASVSLTKSPTNTVFRLVEAREPISREMCFLQENTCLVGCKKQSRGGRKLCLDHSETNFNPNWLYNEGVVVFVQTGPYSQRAGSSTALTTNGLVPRTLPPGDYPDRTGRLTAGSTFTRLRVFRMQGVKTWRSFPRFLAVDGTWTCQEWQ